MEFGKRHYTPRQLVTDLLRGNWCDEFWP